MTLESCRDYEGSADNCASVEDTNAFWDNNSFSLYAYFGLKQVFLKDMDEPMQTVKPVVTTKIGSESNMDKINWKI